MIDVQQGALRAFEQNALARAPLAVKDLERRRHERQNLGRDRDQFFANGRGAWRRQA